MLNRLPADTDEMTRPRSKLRMPGDNRCILLSSPRSTEEAVLPLSLETTMRLLGVVTAGSILVGFVSLSTWLGRKDGDYLMQWVSRTLQVESVAAEHGPGERT